MQDKNYIRILIVGDVVGNIGRVMFQKHIAQLKKNYQIDGIIVNGENSHSSGRGITPKIVNFFKHNGANVITTGNHIWARKDIHQYLAENNDLLRPANFPGVCPGKGVTIFECKGRTVGVINMQGRIFMREFVDCPFRTAESLLTYLKSKTNIIIVDFHAEATSEKIGMGLFLDGKVSCVFGTHTHVQTADERILPKGTAYITDVGMAGSLNSMIGMKKEIVIQNFLSQMPYKFEVDNNPPAVLGAMLVDIDYSSGKAIAIERVRIIDQEIEASYYDE